MALVMGSVVDLPRVIKTSVFRLPPSNVNYDIVVGFEGVTVEEARLLIDFAIKLEQTRTGDVLSPTEYGNRFSGLDFDGT